jgi:hypothetical protein
VHFEGAWTSPADTNVRYDYHLDQLGDPDMALADDQITLTEDTAKEIGKKTGEKVAAATLLQLAVIYAARGDDKAAAGSNGIAEVLAVVQMLTTELNELRADVAKLQSDTVDPDSLPARRALAAQLTAQINAALGV